MYGIETKQARLAYKIGHVDADKIGVGDHLQAWDLDGGRGFSGRIKSRFQIPPTRYELEIHVPRAAIEKIDQIMYCKRCKGVQNYNFFRFSNDTIGIGGMGCKCVMGFHKPAPPEIVEILKQFATWGPVR